MSTMNISLPEEMRSWVEEEMRRGGFSSASEYFRQLLHDARARQEEQAQRTRLQALLIQGIESGHVQAADAAWWESLRTEVGAVSSPSSRGSQRSRRERDRAAWSTC